MEVLGWILAATLYVAGCVETHMRRRHVPVHWALAGFATLFWPVFVLAALLPSQFSYWRRRAQ
jgi:hypothetical protein